MSPSDAQQWKFGLVEIGIPRSWEIAALDFRHHTGSCIGTGKLKGVWLLKGADAVLIVGDTRVKDSSRRRAEYEE